jgi:uncharacterized membrane protein YbaN (DUF454 family)
VNIKIRGSEYDLLPAIRITLGILSFILGIIGAILPVMQGWIFFLISAALFFPRHHFVSRLMKKGEEKVPRFVGWLRRLGVGHAHPEPAPQRVDTSVL